MDLKLEKSIQNNSSLVRQSICNLLVCAVATTSGQFSLDPEQQDGKYEEYFKLLDEDKDTLVSFFDLLTPLMRILPAEVTTMFTHDHRYVQETFNDMRIAFDQVSTTENGATKASIISLRMKLQEHSRSKDLMRQLEGMLTLLRLSDSEAISQTDYLVGLARLEKRAMFTFVSKLYQVEERRHRIFEEREGDKLVRDEVLQETVKTAIADPDLTIDHAKSLLRQMADNLSALETRLIDFEDTNQTFSPEELPQAQAGEENIWARFNAAVPKFMDVVMDTSAPLKD